MKRRREPLLLEGLKTQEEALDDLLKNSLGFPLPKHKESEWKSSSEKLRSLDKRDHGLETAIGGVYWIRAPNSLLAEQWFQDQEWYSQLICKPHKNSLAPGNPKTFSVSYCHPQKKDWIGIPRFLGLSIFGEAQKDIRKSGQDCVLNFKTNRPLREYQLKAVENAISTLNTWGGATLIADCGAGKTAMALRIAAELNRKTLVLCNRSFLMEQWRHDIEGKSWSWADDNSEKEAGKDFWRIKCLVCKEQYLKKTELEIHTTCTKCGMIFPNKWTGCTEPREGWIQGAKVGRLQGNMEQNNTRRVQVHGMDIVIGSIDSLSQCEYPKELLEQFGLIIIDEMHHLGALTLSQVLPKLPAKYLLGITATPDRNDGLEHLLYWLAGPTCFVYKRLPSVTGIRNSVTVHQLHFHGGKREEIFTYGKIGFASMISSLAKDEERNLYILNLVKNLAERKKILIVTSIVDHAKAISNSLPNSIVINGGCSAASIAQAKSTEQKYVVATYQFLEEGYDDSLIDTLVMALPRSKIQQVVGRCERTHDGKLIPLVLDIIDTFSVFVGMSWKRHAFYKSRGFEIKKC